MVAAGLDAALDSELNTRAREVEGTRQGQ
jgi:hypothetical protein